MFKDINSDIEMKLFGESIGGLLCGSEFIELVGDVGSGKTTLTKGIAVGLGIDENVSSPSFTINRVYCGRDDLMMSHYDFYRLNNAGIMSNELQESALDSKTVVVVEWAGLVDGVLPVDRLTINISTISEDSRRLDLSAGGEVSRKIIEGLSL